ncbi:blood vessel epicardial substance [Thecamonas trahens ATCC 50062]|uniref:Blood vessel epicardial substance n=1 Tax=Thecamonas trahens ATCC 50062 TaxID=461836 RepID=A0A0L0DVQ0_THETB|nr:blood vessel epicardial substance [Thecamonas trahens ATCC 50062]KNC56257.1 blood vessel epicardial substance [Thecamonas trahens ATCC 50062]|eukprot:XP_013760779.1 blood vessel epicardial substance [Thecamonas trahens ATCC 50062]
MGQALPPNHVLFQIANILLLASYASPNIFVLRCILAASSVFWVLWAWLILDVAVDTVIYNMMYLVLNLGHLAYLLYLRRPISFDSDHLEAVYTNVFGPGGAGISRVDFLTLVKDKAFVRTLTPGSAFALAGNTPSDLTILIDGEMQVFKTLSSGERKLINRTRPFEFLDSPEWMQRENHPAFLVDIIAATDCTFIIWPRELLIPFLDRQPALASVINSVVGLDIATKLIRTQHSDGVLHNVSDHTAIERTRCSSASLDVDSPHLRPAELRPSRFRAPRSRPHSARVRSRSRSRSRARALSRSRPRSSDLDESAYAYEYVSDGSGDGVPMAAPAAPRQLGRRPTAADASPAVAYASVAHSPRSPAAGSTPWSPALAEPQQPAMRV